MPNRILRGDVCTSEKIHRLKLGFSEILFYRLLTYADDHGRFDARPSVIRGSIFPLEDIKLSQIRDGLNELYDAGLIVLYCCNKNGKWFGEILNFNQRIRVKWEKFPPVDDDCFVGHMSDTCPTDVGQMTASSNPIQTKPIHGKKTPSKKFVAPSEDEVCDYFRENGYSVQVGSTAFKYYDEAGWKDSTGKPVKNWKQKMRGVWFRDEHLAKTDEPPEDFI